MYVLVYFWIFSVILLFLMYGLNLYFSVKLHIDREKGSPFECGFDPLTSPRIPFYVQFFLISLIFLIFDIEIVMMFPLIYFFYQGGFSIQVLNLFSLFIILLFLGLIMEWFQGFIDWIY